MCINGTIQKGVDAFDVVLNPGGVHRWPVCDFCTLNQSFLDGTDSCKACQISVRAPLGMRIP